MIVISAALGPVDSASLIADASALGGAQHLTVSLHAEAKEGAEIETSSRVIRFISLPSGGVTAVQM